jgi:hypothetical protein
MTFIPCQILLHHIDENEVWNYVVTWMGREIHKGFWCKNLTERMYLDR